MRKNCEINDDYDLLPETTFFDKMGMEMKKLVKFLEDILSLKIYILH